MLTDRYFRKVEGGYLFFPYGPFSKSYLVSEAKKSELSSHLEGSLVWGSLGTISLLFLPLWLLKQHRILKGCPRSERQTFAEMHRAMGRTMPRWLLCLSLLCGLLFIAGCLHLAYMSYFRASWGYLALGVGFAVLGCGGIYNCVAALAAKPSSTSFGEMRDGRD
jgi:hypothetical protein